MKQIRPLAEIWRTNAMLQGWKPIVKFEEPKKEQKPKEGFEEILQREERRLNG